MASVAMVDSAASLTVILVDDEAIVRVLARRAMEAAGWTVIEATDGLAALRAAQAEGEQIAAVVTDLTMPLVGGQEVVEVLSRHRPDIPLVCMTGGTDYGAIEVVRSHGVPVLAKPFAPNDLIDLLQHEVQHARVLRERAQAIRAHAEPVRTAAEARRIERRRAGASVDLAAAALAMQRRRRPAVTGA